MLQVTCRFFGHCIVEDSALLSKEDWPFFEMFQVIDFNRGFARGTSGAIRGLLVPVASHMLIFGDQRICTLGAILITRLGLYVKVLSSLAASAS